jgi:DNA-binding transcriptional LysR family regulator
MKWVSAVRRRRREYGLQSFKTSGDEIILIVAPGHQLAEKGKASFADIAAEPFIQREATSGTQRSVESMLSKAGYSPSRLMPHLVVGSSQAVISAVRPVPVSPLSPTWRPKRRWSWAASSR